tara:strand:+ start:1749 stop:2516 length:768 start_codon:yes stop_codon:yes gene_type:complete
MKIILNKRDGHHRSMVAVHENVISREEILWIREYLNSISDFRSGMTSWGKAIPRLQKWYGSDYFGAHWKDQNNPRWMPCLYEPELLAIQEIMQARLDECAVMRKLGLCLGGGGATRRTPARRKCRFGRRGHFKMRNKKKPLNSCLMNKYRDGSDSIKPHRDSEEIFGDNPVVVILSIGAARTLTFRRIIYDEDNLHLIQPETDPALAHEFSVEMKEGSMVIMAGALQKYYSHEITKVNEGKCQTRYSMTFRNFGA